MSDVTAFNNCINVFWRQHEAELSRFLALLQIVGGDKLIIPFC